MVLGDAQGRDGVPQAHELNLDLLAVLEAEPLVRPPMLVVVHGRLDALPELVFPENEEVRWMLDHEATVLDHTGQGAHGGGAVGRGAGARGADRRGPAVSDTRRLAGLGGAVGQAYLWPLNRVAVHPRRTLVVACAPCRAALSRAP